MNYFAELQSALAQLDPTPLLAFVRACEGTLWLAGNGGSASTAQHWACDLSKAAGRRVQALGSNPAVLTAWANDEGYEMAWAYELMSLAQPNDRLITLSCSGNSDNVMQLLLTATERGIRNALITSMLGTGAANSDIDIIVPHTHYGIIEDCHLAIGHWLTEELQK